jgi:hypothetical protein
VDVELDGRGGHREGDLVGVDKGLPGDPGLLTQLISNRLWLADGAREAAAVVLQAWASRLIPVTLAQPVLVLGLPFAAVFRNVFIRRNPPWRDIAGCLACASAVALLSCSPRRTAAPGPGRRRPHRARRRASGC